MKKEIKNIARKMLPPGARKKLGYIADAQKRDFLIFNATGKKFIPVLPPFPPMVMIETTTRCNLSCSHCPNSRLSREKDWSGDIDTGLFKRIIDEIAIESPDTIVRPFDGGEPLMRKDLEELISYAYGKGIKNIYINTNGHLMTEKRARALIRAGLSRVEFSVDAVSPETYKKIRNSGDFDKLIANINNFLLLKREFRPEAGVSVSFVRQKDNLHEEQAFVRFWNKKVDFINFREYHQHGGLVDRHGKHKANIKKHRYPCPYIWKRINVHHDGRVKFCENDWACRYPIGDLTKSTLKEIWNSEAYRALRKSHVEGDFSHENCRECPDWQWIIW